MGSGPNGFMIMMGAALVLLFILVFMFLKKKRPAEKEKTSTPTFTGLPLEEDVQREFFSPRVKTDWLVTIETAEGTVEAMAGNMSIGNTFIACENPLEIKDKFKMSIHVPDRDPIDVTAEVTWHNKNFPADRVVSRGMGVRFVEISAEDRRFLNDFCMAPLAEEKTF
jgi:uncharacterized protein (TIGR02266 family)